MMMVMKVFAFIALMAVTSTYARPFGKFPLYLLLYFFSPSSLTNLKQIFKIQKIQYSIYFMKILLLEASTSWRGV